MKKFAWNISKEIRGLEYAHRVYSQDIRHALCCEGDTNACKRLHGHSGQAKITVGGNELENNFVCDFKELGFLKKVLVEMFDHRTVLDVNDPIANKLAQGTLLYAGKQGDMSDDNAIIVIEVDQMEYQLSIVPFVTDGTDAVLFYRVCPKDIAHMREVFEGNAYGSHVLDHMEALSLIDFVPSSENFVKKIFDFAESVLSPYGIHVVSTHWKETEKSEAVYFGQ